MPDAVELLDVPLLADVGARIVAEAERLADAPVAIYVVDLDGTALRRVAGTVRLAEEIPAGRFVGPELALDGDGDVAGLLLESLRALTVVPLWLRGRATAVLVLTRAPRTPLEPLATQAALALELADLHTDLLARPRRRRATTAAAETQENLLPRRLAVVDGAELAATILPAYDVGGDWFDHAADADGAWLAIADAVGKGVQATALSAVALGALRAARRSGVGLEQAVQAVHDVVRALDRPGAYITAVVGAGRPPPAPSAGSAAATPSPSSGAPVAASRPWGAPTTRCSASRSSRRASPSPPTASPPTSGSCCSPPA